jgi:histidinol dehydrogenase
MPIRINSNSSNFGDEFRKFLNSQRETLSDVENIVAQIISQVKDKGDHALFDFTKKFDDCVLTEDNIRISESEIDNSYQECNTHELDALKMASDRIRSFHEKQFPDNYNYIDSEGVELGLKWNPIEAVGIYVPGGSASYPSSVLMNAIPARVAGVKRLVMVSPSTKGKLNPLVLAAAKISGVDEIYRIGGAQAIGALAYGCNSLNAVDKIVGPGNAYVAAAKRQVFGTVGIDMVAGPSEILVVADNKNDPEWIAVDLLSQAEHDPLAQSILITDDIEFANKVEEAIDASLPLLIRKDIATASWVNFGAIIIINNMGQAPEVVNKIAPEHLELAIDEPQKMADKIVNAGAIFLGRVTPEALGDYVAGPNHVLPTSRTSRFSSGLGLIDFMKRTTIVGATESSIKKIGPAATVLAEAEGLGAHALSIKLRLGRYRDA